MRLLLGRADAVAEPRAERAGADARAVHRALQLGAHVHRRRVRDTQRGLLRIGRDVRRRGRRGVPARRLRRRWMRLLLPLPLARALCCAHARAHARADLPAHARAHYAADCHADAAADADAELQPDAAADARAHRAPDAAADAAADAAPQLRADAAAIARADAAADVRADPAADGDEARAPSCVVCRARDETHPSLSSCVACRCQWFEDLSLSLSFSRIIGRRPLDAEPRARSERRGTPASLLHPTYKQRHQHQHTNLPPSPSRLQLPVGANVRHERVRERRRRVPRDDRAVRRVRRHVLRRLLRHRRLRLLPRHPDARADARADAHPADARADDRAVQLGADVHGHRVHEPARDVLRLQDRGEVRATDTRRRRQYRVLSSDDCIARKIKHASSWTPCATRPESDSRNAREPPLDSHRRGASSADQPPSLSLSPSR